MSGQSEIDLAAETPPEPGCCTAVHHDLSNGAVTTDLETLSTVSSGTRYETVRAIAANDGGVCVCEIVAALDVSQGAVSQALSRLHEADLVTRRKEGRWRYYESTKRADKLLATLDEVRSNDE